MKKIITIISAFIIAFFVLPFGNEASADEKDYSNIKNGEYEITAKAMNASEDKESAAAGFINDTAKLSIHNGEIEFTLTVPKNPMAEITSFKIEGNEPNVKGEAWTYNLASLKSELHATVSYEVPSIGMVHDDVALRFVLEGLDDLPVNEEEQKEPEQPEPAPEERVVGGIISESAADAVYELEYGTDSKATSGNLLNPVKLLEKDGKTYIQIPINERGAQYFRSLEIDGKQVTWNSITEGPYTIQFELLGNLEDTLMIDMVIQAGPNVMPHNGIEMWLNTDAIKTIKEPKPKPTPNEPIKAELDQPIKISGGEDVIINDDLKITIPEGLPENVELTISSKNKEVKNQGDLKIAGQVYEFDFKNLGDNHGTFEIGFNYDQKKYSAGKYEVAVYYYDEAKEEWIKQDSIIKDGKVFAKVDHFSTYGVFAKEIETKENPKQEPKNDPKDVELLKPDRVSEIDYIVKHETEDRPSAADMFFKKPAKLLYKNGEKYIQLTVTDSKYINSLSTANGNVLIVKENSDGSVVIQFKVNGNLSDVIDLDMVITVPGVYENQPHSARLFLDPSSETGTDVSEYLLVAGSKDNLNGPLVEGVESGDSLGDDNGDPVLNPEKPEFTNGDGDDSKDTTTPGTDKTDNPKTGDSSMIYVYALLLIGSLIPLVIKFRRRFV